AGNEGSLRKTISSAVCAIPPAGLAKPRRGRGGPVLPGRLGRFAERPTRACGTVPGCPSSPTWEHRRITQRITRLSCWNVRQVDAVPRRARLWDRQPLLANYAGFGGLVKWFLVTGNLPAVLPPMPPVGRVPRPISFQPAPHRQPRPADERSVARGRLADQHQLPCVHRGGVCHAPKPSSVTAVDIHGSPSTPCGSDFRPTGVLCG